MLSRPLNELVAAFEDASLARDEWTHEAHLGVALTFCLAEKDQERALERMRSGIQRYNAATGVVDGPMSGYHETLTVFWIRHVWAFASEHPGLPEEVFPPLLEKWGESRAPLRFYSKRMLMNPTARARFVAPDLAPFEM